MDDGRRLLFELFEAAVAAGRPERILAPYLPEPPRRPAVIVGAGKAAAAMALAVETAWEGVPFAPESFVVVPRGARLATRRIEVLEAAHPLADPVSEAAARRALRIVRGLSKDDLVLALLSGGGSALLAAPVARLTLADKQQAVAALMRAGAPIAEMNCVRKHLSAVKGGRLAKEAAPARVVSLAISDVPGDAASLIASGPTVADPTSAEDALHILERYGVADAKLRAALATPAAETPKPGDRLFASSDFRLIARPRDALDAAAAVARARGLTPVILGDAIEGEARAAARAMAARALAVQGKPLALLSGGEVTVSLGMTAGIKGGPNREFALALALALDAAPGIAALIADSDGIDGNCDENEPVAGAIVHEKTLTNAAALGLDAEAALAAHATGAFFAALGDEVAPGVTHTNLNDFRVVLSGLASFRSDGRRLSASGFRPAP